MIFFYRIIINFIIILSPLIILIRLLKKKEHPIRFKEKFCFFSKKRGQGKAYMVSWSKCRGNSKYNSFN